MATNCSFDNCQNTTVVVEKTGAGPAVCADCTPRILEGERPP